MEQMNREGLIALILSARAGNDEAFNEIVARYTPLIHSLIRKHLLPLDEYFSEACIGIYNAVRTYNIDQDGVTFGLYAHILIARQLADSARKSNDATDHTVECDIDGIAVSDGIVARLERQEERAEFRDVARSLLSDYEYRVLLLWLDGYKTAAIARILGTTAKSVDNAKTRILKKLRDGLSGRHG